MKFTKYLIFLGFVIFIVGCASTQPPSEHGKYSFQYEGESYTIYSTNPIDHTGYNTLLLKQDGQTMLLAVDIEQDGIIDEVRIGDVPLNKAQNIYDQGINLSKKNGLFSSPKATRYFKYSNVKYEYEIQTYLLAAGESYNIFAIRIQEENPTPVIFKDNGANGKLDNLLSVKGSLADFQRTYQDALEAGIAVQRIIKSKGMYRVTENSDQ